MPESEGSTADRPEILSPDVKRSMGDAISSVVGGVTLPLAIARNLNKVLDRLCTSAVEIPVAYIDGFVAEKRAETAARVKLIEQSAEQIAGQMVIDPEYARAAVKKFGFRVIREQLNLDAVTTDAAAQIEDAAVGAKIGDDAKKEIDDDWLNQFEKEAAQRSAGDMQKMFSRILAGEILRPSSFSIRAIRILGQMDQRSAALFRKLCSCCIAMRVGRGSDIHLIDVRVPSLAGTAGNNSLQKFGLSFDQLNTLNEHGLIISEYNSWVDYKLSIARGTTVTLPLWFQNRYWGLIERSGQAGAHEKEFKISGVALTKAGKELFRIIDPAEALDYKEALQAYFGERGLDMSPAPVT